MSSKCKYHKICKGYRKNATTCNEYPGNYCGKFRKLANIGVRVNVF